MSLVDREEAPGPSAGRAAPPVRAQRRTSWRWGDPPLAHPSIPVLRRAAVVYIVVTVVLLVLGAGVVWADRSGAWPTALDRQVETALGQPRPAVLRDAIGPLTGLTDPFTVIGVAGASLAILSALHRWRQVTVLAAAVGLELAVFLTVSLLVARDRPPSAPADAPFTGSFPSGHAAMAVALWGGLAVVVTSLAARAWVARVAAVTAGLAALGAGSARLVLGYHALSDVLVGWALGGACLVVATRLADRLDTAEPPLLGSDRPEAPEADRAVAARR